MLSRVHLFVTPWTATRQASLSITNSRSLLRLMSIESVMPSSHLILCRLLLLPPSMFPSVSVFSSETLLCITWPKDWTFSFSITPSSEHSGLISLATETEIKCDLHAIECHWFGGGFLLRFFSGLQTPSILFFFCLFVPFYNLILACGI